MSPGPPRVCGTQSQEPVSPRPPVSSKPTPGQGSRRVSLTPDGHVGAERAGQSAALPAPRDPPAESSPQHPALQGLSQRSARIPEDCRNRWDSTTVSGARSPQKSRKLLYHRPARPSLRGRGGRSDPSRPVGDSCGTASSAWAETPDGENLRSAP